MLGFSKLQIVIFIFLLFVLIFGIVYLNGNPSLKSRFVPGFNLPKAGSPFPSTVRNSNSNTSQNIIITSPIKNQKVEQSFTITGSARVFENQLNYRVKDASGNTILEGTITADANTTKGGDYGNFETTVSSLPKGNATIEVFDYSAKDGSEIDKVSVPVIVN